MAIKIRIGSKEERVGILQLLTRALIVNQCSDLEILKQVDRLCRRTWSDIHPGWVMWSYYLENLLGSEAYSDWARINCGTLSVI